MRVLERLKTILFIGLFVSALLLAALYIIDTPGRSAQEFGDVPPDVLATLRGSTVAPSVGFEREQLLPTFLGIRHGGGQEVGLLSGAEMMEDLVELLAPWFSDVLGVEAVCETLDAAEGDALWRACMTNVNYFYLSWSFSVPASLLRAHQLPEDDLAMLEMAQGDLPAIKEIFFLPGAADDLFAVSRDSAGTVSTWRCDRSMQIRLPGILTFSAYLEKNVLSAYRFAGLLDTNVDVQLATLPVFEQSPLIDILQVRTPLAGNNDATRLNEAMLELYAYNLSKLGSYYEADTDTVIYIETHGTLRVSADAINYTATASGGLDVTDFVRESDVTALTLRDDLIACESIVSLMRQADRTCIGGEAVPRLTAIEANEDTLIVDYAYFYDNIRIDADVPAIRLTIRAHKIVAVEVCALGYTSSDTQSAANGQRWMRNLADYLDGNFEIRLSYADSGEGRMLAAWHIYQFS